MQDSIVFTDWYTVIIGSQEIPVKDFFKNLEKKLETKEYNVSFNKKNKKFVITYDGESYNVVFPLGISEELAKDVYQPLPLKLVYLSKIEEQINREKDLQEVKSKKLKLMKESNYENIETLGDYEILLEGYVQELQKAKSDEEKELLNTKIANIVRISEELEEEQKPYNYQFDVNKIIHGLFEKIDKLDEEDTSRYASSIRGIVNDYYKSLEHYYEKRDKELFVGNPLVPMDIIDRIIDIECSIAPKLRGISEYAKVSDALNELKSSIDKSLNNEGGVSHGSR